MQRDSDQSLDQISEQVGLSRDAVWKRIRTMEYAFAYRSRAGFDGDAFAWNIRRELGFDFDVHEGDAVREVEPALGPNYNCLVVSRAHHGTIDEPGNYVKDLAATFADEGGRILTDHGVSCAR